LVQCARSPWSGLCFSLPPGNQIACCALIQAVVRRLPTSATRVPDREKSIVRSVVDRAALGQGFSQSTSVSLAHSFNPPILPQSSPSTIQGWYSRPRDGSTNSGLEECSLLGCYGI
jgi:hypothetical protein